MQGPSAMHWFGTDQLGRDLAARVVSAIPVVLWAPLGAVLLAAGAGSAIGVLAGYRRGRLERVLMAGTDVLLAMPGLLTAILIVGVFGGGARKRRPNEEHHKAKVLHWSTNYLAGSALCCPWTFADCRSPGPSGAASPKPSICGSSDFKGWLPRGVGPGLVFPA